MHTAAGIPVLRSASFRCVSLRFVSFRVVSVPLRCVSFRFVPLWFVQTHRVSLPSVSFRPVPFCFVSFRAVLFRFGAFGLFRFVLVGLVVCPSVSSSVMRPGHSSVFLFSSFSSLRPVSIRFVVPVSFRFVPYRSVSLGFGPFRPFTLRVPFHPVPFRFEAAAGAKMIARHEARRRQDDDNRASRAQSACGRFCQRLRGECHTHKYSCSRGVRHETHQNSGQRKRGGTGNYWCELLTV